MSALSYLESFFGVFFGWVGRERESAPVTMGYLRCGGVTVSSERPLPVSIDGENFTSTSLVCEVRHGALKLNVGSEVVRVDADTEPSRTERVDVGNLPAGKELRKAKGQRIPIFAYASEERFRDLFVALRDCCQRRRASS